MTEQRGSETSFAEACKEMIPSLPGVSCMIALLGDQQRD